MNPVDQSTKLTDEVKGGTKIGNPGDPDGSDNNPPPPDPPSDDNPPPQDAPAPDEPSQSDRDIAEIARKILINVASRFDERMELGYPAKLAGKSDEEIQQAADKEAAELDKAFTKLIGCAGSLNLPPWVTPTMVICLYPVMRMGMPKQNEKAAPTADKPAEKPGQDPTKIYDADGKPMDIVENI